VRDGTDVSAALLTTVARLHESEREPRVVILLTDGAHNGVGIPPMTAARAAEALGVRVHAISVLGPEAGDRSGAARGTGASAGGSQGDMRTVLEGISALTGGVYFHASSGAALDSIYREIDRIERPVEEITEVEVAHSVRGWPLLAGLLFLGLEGVLRGSRLGVVP
jgi:Ca-activated chloride channel family protein